MAQHTGFGTSFSPIPVEQTEEELQAFLARMFGPGGGGVGVGRLPTPQVRGVPPNEILRAFLASRAGGGVPPDIASFVLAPQRPAIAGAPTIPAAQVPDGVPEGPTTGALGGAAPTGAILTEPPEVAPGTKEERLLELLNLTGGGPSIPGGLGEGPPPEEEEDEFLQRLLDGGLGGETFVP